MHHTPHNPDELVQIRKQEIPSDRLLRRIWHLQNLETRTPDEIPKVIKQRNDVNVSRGCKIIAETAIGVFRKVLVFQSVYQRFESLYDTIEIDGVQDFAEIVNTFDNHPIRREFADPFISDIEGDTFFRRCNLHEKGFKATISTDIGNEMCKIGIIFFKELGMRLRKVCHSECLRFGNI